MIKTETIVHKICDLCGKECETLNENIGYPVLFATSKYDGAPCEPYLENTRLDLCEACSGKVLKIKAYGMQGYIKYEYWE